MTDKQLSDKRLDDAIDRAVREIMSVEPRTDLRARVLAELERGAARAALWPRLAFASAAIAVALLLLTTIVQRPTERREAPQVATARPSPASPGGTTPVPASPPAAAPPTPRAHVGDRLRVIPPGPAAGARNGPTVIVDRPIQAASIDTLDTPVVEPVTSVQRLPPIEPLGIATLDVLRLSTPEIVINPITVEQIDIAPLDTRR
jgi:hypothetical protein